MHGALRPEQGAHKVFDVSKEMKAAGEHAKKDLSSILDKRGLTDEVQARVNRIMDDFNSNLTRRAMQHIKNMATTELGESLSAHRFFERKHEVLPSIPATSVDTDGRTDVEIPMEQRLIDACVALLNAFLDEAGPKAKRTLSPIGPSKAKRRRTDKT